MTTHEDRKRELASRVEPGPGTARVGWLQGGLDCVGFCASYEALSRDDEQAAMEKAGADARLAAFHDRKTVLLEADVLAAAREFWRLPCDRSDAALEKAFAALDEHFKQIEEEQE